MSNFESTAKLLLRSSEQHITEDDLDALKEIRTHAIQQPLKRRLPAFLAPAAGMVTASLLAFVLVSSPFFSVNDDSFVNSEGSEFYEELEFYYWLASEENGYEG